LSNKIYILIIIICTSLYSCDYLSFKNQNNQKILAKVYDDVLYLKDIKSIIPHPITKEDSLVYVNNYVNNWARQKLLLNKAKLNLNENILVFDKLVNKYKEDLYINKYKEEVIKQYLDTTVSKKNIKDFYKKNRNNFRLNEILVKLKYIEIGNSVLNKKEFIKLFKSNKKEDLETLDDKRLQLKSAALNDSTWVRYSDVLSKIPFLKKEDKRRVLKKMNFIEIKDSLSLYLVAIKNVLRRNDLAPRSYIAPTIKEIILHKRELNLIKTIEETLTNDAIKNNKFEIFTGN